MKHHNVTGSRRGSALVMAIMLFTSMLVMSYAFFQIVISADKQLDAGMDDQRAFYLAEAALFESMQAIRGGGTGAIASEAAPVYFGGGVYWVERQPVPATQADGTAWPAGTMTNPMRLAITAMAGKGRQSLEVIVRDETEDASLFVATLNSKDTLTMNADVVVDSYQSSLGDYASQVAGAINGHPHANLNGHVRSNQDIILNSRATIFGDATPGPTGDVDDAATDTYISGSDTPADEVFNFPPIEVPSFPSLGAYDTPAGNSTTIASGQYAYDSLTVGNGGTLTIEGPAEIVVQDFTGNKDGQLLVDATNGPVTIYVEGSYTHIKDFTCDAVAGSPMALAFMVTAPQDIVFPSFTDIRGAYYLPEANILFSSGNEAWGSFAANKIEMANDMNFHFDEDLADYFKADTGQSAGLYAVLSWSETEVVQHDLLSDRRDPLTILGVGKYDLPRPTDAWVVAP